MNHYLIWLTESGISLAIFYLAYRFFLNREYLFQSNRGYLLFALLFSILLPFLKIPSPVDLHYSHYLPELVVTENTGPAGIEVHGSVSWALIIWYLYLTGVVIMTGTFLFRLTRLALFIRNSSIERTGNIFLSKTSHKHSPFSFFHFIVLGEANLSPEERNKILEHEKVHVRQLHTLDILLVEIIAIFQWFNPFIWLYKSSLKELHEYLADREVIRKGASIPMYQQLLLNFQLRKQFLTLANNFNYSLTKKRFIMMTKSSRNPLSGFRFLMILPALLAIISFTKLYASGNTETQNPPPDKAVKQTPEEIFIQVEEMPKFGEEDKDGLAFRKYIAEKLRYPEKAAKNGIQGRLFVQFIVDHEGVVKDAKVLRFVNTHDGQVQDTEALKEGYQMLEDEALRVVNSSPKWIPGKQRGKAVNVQFVFPISFVLNDAKKE